MACLMNWQVYVPQHSPGENFGVVTHKHVLSPEWEASGLLYTLHFFALTEL